MKKILTSLVVLTSLMISNITAEVAIVPQPKSIKELASPPVNLSAQTPIFYSGKEAKSVADLLAESLQVQTGLSLIRCLRYRKQGLRSEGCR